ncbi:MAG TPA: glycosyltransferase [candidate division Zixibacteria bacterium]|nr:glycosyltransferase [candidate division Zixibacteria bacterium]
MKVLVLTKRQYMGKDLLDDRFGRFRELPAELANLGHEVRGVTLSYRRRNDTTVLDSARPGGPSVMWESFDLTSRAGAGAAMFIRRSVEIIGHFEPDVIWAGSDAFLAVLGAWLARRRRLRSVIDLYDNFEAFGASRLPLIVPLFRRAVRSADGVTCFSRRLAAHITRDYRRLKPTVVIENGVRTELFRPLDRRECRLRLGLPETATIVGTAGALDRSRGIETLFSAFELLAAERSDLWLALAGPIGRGVSLPDHPRVRYLGNLPHHQVPDFVNALDLSVVCYRHSSQGEYSFPQKAYEILACRVPIVAAAVGTMIELLERHPDHLYEAENPSSLAAAVTRQLRERQVLDLPVPSWRDSAAELERFLLRLSRNS